MVQCRENATDLRRAGSRNTSARQMQRRTPQQALALLCRSGGAVDDGRWSHIVGPLGTPRRQRPGVALPFMRRDADPLLWDDTRPREIGIGHTSLKREGVVLSVLFDRRTTTATSCRAEIQPVFANFSVLRQRSDSLGAESSTTRCRGCAGEALNRTDSLIS